MRLISFEEITKTIQFFFRSLLRATRFAVALFFLVIVVASKNSFSAPVTKSASPGRVETYQDVIEKAYALSLQKDRTQAINLLASAAQKESKKSQPPKDLLQALNEVATVFYSDKAQQAYELALSFRQTDTSLASSKLSEVLQIEPDNLQAQLEQIRMMLSNSDCDTALKQAKKLDSKYIFLESIHLVVAQAHVCLGQFAEYQKLKNKVDSKKTNTDIFWLSLDQEVAFRQGQIERAKEIMTSTIGLEKDFPETYYWGWKIALHLKDKEDRSASRYTSLCKSLSARALRKYAFEPRLCRRTGEIDNEPKKEGGLGNE